jgi:beta-lactamase regulating signal transducer with metallopeptidase domain
MITAIALLCYGVTADLLMPLVLPRLWPTGRAPRCKAAVLLLLAISLPLSAIAAGLALGVTLMDALSRADAAMDDCANQLPVSVESPLGPVLGGIGIAVASAVVLRIAYCLLAAYLAARLKSRLHAATLGLCGHTDRSLGTIVVVIEHARPACYCLPGRRGRIVVTSEAIRLLSTKQLGAVLAHERAHQRGRHHLLLGLAAALRRAFPWLRMLTYTEHELRALIELIADDAAAREYDRPTVASALTVLGLARVPPPPPSPPPSPSPPPPPTPTPTSGRTALTPLTPLRPRSTALTRITRMSTPPPPKTRRHTALTAATLAAAVALPFALVAFSIAGLMTYCPPSPNTASPAPKPPALAAQA